MSARRLAVLALVVALATVACSIGTAAPDASDDKNPPLPGTKPLTVKGDIASELVAGVDRFLLREIDKSVARRAAHWKRDFSSTEAYNKSIEPNRKRLAHILGVRDLRIPIEHDLRLWLSVGPSPWGSTKKTSPMIFLWSGRLSGACRARG